MDVQERVRKANCISRHLKLTADVAVNECRDCTQPAGCTLISRLGSSRRSLRSEGGEAHLACCGKKKAALQLAIKFAPVGEAELHLLQQQQASDWEKKAMQCSAFVEARCNALASKLVRAGVCPHLPMQYAVAYTGFAYYSNTALFERSYVHSYPTTVTRMLMDRRVCPPRSWGEAQQRRDELCGQGYTHALPCMLLFCELADGTAVEWFLQRRRSELQWFCMLFQVLCGLRAMNAYYGVVHHDMRGENILYHSQADSQKHSFHHYHVDGCDYYLPNYGHCFVLWDFGMAASCSWKTDVLQNNAEQRCAERHSYDRLLLHRASVEATDVQRLAYWVLTTLPLNYPQKETWIPPVVRDWLRKALQQEWTPQQALQKLPSWMRVEPEDQGSIAYSFQVTKE